MTYPPNKMYDCIVIGAGPAGATCARYLARLGVEVLLIDREQFPRDKPCGGGFSMRLFHEFPYLSRRHDQLVRGVCRTGVIHSPNRRVVLRGRVEMAVGLRREMDNALVEEAVSAGAGLVTARAKSIDVRPDCVIVRLSGDARDDEVRGRVVVGADGVNSMVARQTGLNSQWSRRSLCVCQVAEVPVAQHMIDDIYGVDREYHFFANVEGLPGYGWLFPKQETINIGLGIVGTHAVGLPARFRRFVRYIERTGLLPSGTDISSARGALVPIGGTLRQTYADRCLLAGDSAGMVNPLTGGGIGYAMRAGRLAAHVINRALEDEDVSMYRLSEYQRRWWSDFGHEIRPMLMAQRLFTSPLTDVLLEIARRDSILQEMVADAMSETDRSGGDIGRLVLRVMHICLREALS